jgi:CheY-like chemotaxis protein/HPt (histidine-containing phosphotransfer) domain-containing protein
MLKQFGCRVDFVDNGLQAVNAVRNKEYDLVLMDCQMPEMDGYEATRAIRAHEKGEEVNNIVKIVALTAHALGGDRERCLAAGMDEYMSKPFKQDDLQEMLRKLFADKMVRPRQIAPGELQRMAKTAAPGQPASTISATIEETSVGTTTERKGREPAIDVTVLAGLDALQIPGEPSVKHQVVRAYLNSGEPTVAKLKIFGEARQLKDLGIAAHTLKSSSANVGALRLAKMCARLEAVAGEGLMDAMGELIEAIHDEYRHVKDSLNRELGIDDTQHT